MRLTTRSLFISAILSGALLASNVQAGPVQIDFEPAALTGLYFAGDSFHQGGFKMTVDYDFGTVDGAGGLGGSAPSGNSGQYYSQLNEGGLILERENGGLFDLNGFDAAFIPLSPPASGNTIIVAAGIKDDGTQVGIGWLFASAGSGGAFPFAQYSAAADFANFTSMRSVEFFACSYDGVNLCASAVQNNGQFALDNIKLTVPEPSMAALLGLNLGLLALSRRRRQTGC